MARKKRQHVDLDFAFFTYLHRFYVENRGRIRMHFRDISKKFLDFNDPTSGAFLREPQFEALEIYVFLKEYLSNRHVHEIFADWHAKENGFEGRSNRGIEQLELFGDLNDQQYNAVFNYIRRSGGAQLSELYLRTPNGNGQDDPHGDLHLLRVSACQ